MDVLLDKDCERLPLPGGVSAEEHPGDRILERALSRLEAETAIDGVFSDHADYSAHHEFSSVT